MAQTLIEFVTQEHIRLSSFELDWQRKHKAEPENYPLEMKSGQEGLWVEFLNEYEVK